MNKSDPYNPFTPHPRRRRLNEDDNAGIYIAQSKTEVIQHIAPHYTDERFRNARTVFGTERADLHYVYSDRLWESNWERARLSAEIANNDASVRLNTAAWYERFLSAYFDKKITIGHILAGWNWSSGYAYQAFGYTEEEKPL